jgi:3,4-dihydroxy 2-butanone 4-phosphate synthase / GTP cyclohydrolase II
MNSNVTPLPTGSRRGPFEVLDPDPIRRVELALEELRQGRMIVVCDDEDRENEGDLVIAGEQITPEAINFMAVHGRGLICLSITSEQVARLGLQMMAPNNQSAYGTAFTVSIEARQGVTTGISAADRAHTVKVAIDPRATPRDIVVPGHMFPLRARDGGVLERVGQTEGSVDLCRLAGLNPSAVICEIVREDGTMARMPDLMEFGRKHQMRICTVADIIKYRMRNERVVRREGDGSLDIPGLGTFQTRLYRGTTGGTHLAVWRGALSTEPILARVQGSPPPWGLLDPSRSRLARQSLDMLGMIAREGRGVLVLMHLDQRGPETLQKLFQADFGGTVDTAPQTRADALRDLGTGCQILLDLGVSNLRLCTNSDRPIVGIDAYGVHIVERVPLSTQKEA